MILVHIVQMKLHIGYFAYFAYCPYCIFCILVAYCAYYLHITLHIILHIVHIRNEKSLAPGFRRLFPLFLGPPSQGPAVHVPPPTNI